jgi:hypothetical protein
VGTSWQNTSPCQPTRGTIGKVLREQGNNHAERFSFNEQNDGAYWLERMFDADPTVCC